MLGSSEFLKSENPKKNRYVTKSLARPPFIIKGVFVAAVVRLADAVGGIVLCGSIAKHQSDSAGLRCLLCLPVDVEQILRVGGAEVSPD